MIPYWHKKQNPGVSRGRRNNKSKGPNANQQGNRAANQQGIATVFHQTGGNVHQEPGPARKRPSDSELDILICCKCKRYYELAPQDFAYQGYGHHYQGRSSRVPLILTCDHTICEDCIRAAAAAGTDIICSRCQTVSVIDKKAYSDHNLRHCFQINYYLVGVLCLTKAHSIGVQKFDFVPAGSSLQRTFGFPTLLLDSNKMPIESTENCRKPGCKKQGDLRCIDCVQIYCTECSETLHKSAIGLMKHQVVPLVTRDIDYCEKHPSALLDVHCENCNEQLCNYCFMNDHMGHKYERITSLKDGDREEFEELVQSAEEKLTKLLETYKKTNFYLHTTLPPSNSANVQSTDSTNRSFDYVAQEIRRCFTDLHAKLDNMHERMRQSLQLARHADQNSLVTIHAKVHTDYATLSAILAQAHNVLETSNSGTVKSGSVRAGSSHSGRSSSASCDSNTRNAVAQQPQTCNVALLRQRLKNALELPCVLVRGERGSCDTGTGGTSINHENVEFFSNLNENLDKFFQLNINMNDPYKLVKEDEIVEGYTIASDYSDMDEISSNHSSGLYSMDCVAKPEDKSVSEMTMKSMKNQSKNQQPVMQFESQSQRNLQIYPKSVDEKSLVTISNIISPESIYVQLVENQKYFRYLQAEINEYVKTLTASSVEAPKIGELYLAKTGVRWLRARVIESKFNAKLNDSLHSVLYVDNGKKEIVTRMALRELNIGGKIRDIPPLALHCRLFDLYPMESKWHPETVKLMEQMLSYTSGYIAPAKYRNIESPKTMMVVANQTNGMYEIDLIALRDEGYTSVRDALTFIGYGKPYSTQKPVHNLSDRTNVRIFDCSTTFEKNQQFRVVISHIVDAHNIFIHLHNFISHIKDLVQNMNSWYTEKNKGYIYTPKIGNYVAVQYIHEMSNHWYRGKIIEVKEGSGLVDVFLLDIGEVIMTKWTMLRKLVDKFTVLECQAIKVKLADVAPITGDKWSKESTDFLKKYLQSEITDTDTLEMTVANVDCSPEEVVLFECLPTIHKCVNSLLVNSQLAISTGKLSDKDHIDWPQVRAHRHHPTHHRTSDSFTLDLISMTQCSKTPTNDDSVDSDECDTVEFMSAPLSSVVSSGGATSKATARTTTTTVPSRGKSCDGGEDLVNYPVNRRHAAYLLLVRSPDELYIRASGERFDKTEREFVRMLQEYYMSGVSGGGGSLVTNDKWETGELCVAYNILTKQYHRGRILGLDKQNKQEYRIICCDRAIEFTASLNVIGELIDKFRISPLFAMRCHLGGIMSMSGNYPIAAQELVKQVCNVMGTQVFYSRYAGPQQEGNKSLPIVLWYSEFIPGGPLEKSSYKYFSVNKRLVKNGLAVYENNRNPFIQRKPQPQPQSQQPKPTVSVKTENISIPDSEDSDGGETTLKTVIETVKSETTTDLEVTVDWAEQVSVYELLEQSGTSSRGNTTAAGTSREKKVFCKKLDSNCEDKLGSESSTGGDVINEDSDDEDAVSRIVNINDWKPALTLKRKHFRANVTNVDDNGAVYLHDVSLEPVLLTIKEDLTERVANYDQKSINRKWSVGDICSVRYHGDSGWYRGKILEITPAGYRTAFVDYGNEELAKAEDISPCRSCENIPTVSTAVRLYNVYPKHKSWVTSVLDVMHSLLVEKEIIVKIKGPLKPKKGRLPEAVLYTNDRTDINEYLLAQFKCLSGEETTQTAESSDSEDVVIISDETVSSSRIPTSEIDEIIESLRNTSSSDIVFLKYDGTEENMTAFTQPDLNIGQIYPVKIISVLDFNNVIVECTPSDYNELEFTTLEKELKSGKYDNQPPLRNFIIGQACMAKFSVDNDWYRAAIAEYNEKAGTARVFFVDYGNFENVVVEDIREPDLNWFRIPICNYMVLIHGIELPEKCFRELALSNFEKILGNVIEMEIVGKDPFLVNLYKKSTNELIYQSSIDSGLLRVVED